MSPTLRMLRYLKPEQVARRLLSRCLGPWYRSSSYDRLFLASRGVALRAFPPAPWPGDGADGRRLLEGRIRLLGRTHPFGVPIDWQARGQSPLWRFALHYFEWLSDVKAAAGENAGGAATRARAAIDDWMAVHPRPEAVAWHPYPLSLRIYAWLACGPFILAGADGSFRSRFVLSLDRQARHLARVVERDVGGNHLIKNLKALIAAGRCVEGHDSRPALAELERAVALQVLPDGCHCERSPFYHLQVLRDLIDVRNLVADDAPAWLHDAVRRMAAALSFFRHGDGGLALFNDGEVGDAAAIAAVERRLGGLPASPDSLPDAGYHRLEAGSSLVLIDTGRCCPDELPAHAHADTLSFELSAARARVIVNCGTFAYQDAAWRNRLRGTAAHSTAAVDGEDSAEVYGVFRLGRRPRDVGGRRGADSSGLFVEGHHDGYRHLGLIHRRRLHLSPDGRALSGEDRVQRLRVGGAERRVTVRFHLHPDVRAEGPNPDGTVNLAVPESGAWRFEAVGEAVRLDESAYAPRFNEMRTTRQIVVEKALDASEVHLAWCLRHEDGS